MQAVNCPRFLAFIGLCGLVYQVGLPVNIGNLSFVSFAMGQPATLTKSQSDALNAYNKTVQDFRSIFERAARTDQFESKAARPCRDRHSILLASA